MAMWVHTNQVHLSFLDEAVQKLTLLINTGDDWDYAFMQLNKDNQHIPLSSNSHITTMINGVLSRSTLGHPSQLEVCKLLQCGDQVVSPKGLNGGLEPIQISLLEMPVWDMDTLGKPVHEPLLLQVDLSSIRPRDQMPITPPPCGASTPPSSPHSDTECPSETATHPSMATELQELLSQVKLDTSSPASGDTTLRRPTSVALGVPLTIRVEDPLGLERPVLAAPKPVATSQQASP